MVYDKIVDYCSKNKLTVSDFEKKCGLSNGAVGKWKNGIYPSIPTLQKIEIATKIPMEKWLE